MKLNTCFSDKYSTRPTNDATKLQTSDAAHRETQASIENVENCIRNYPTKTFPRAFQIVCIWSNRGTALYGVGDNALCLCVSQTGGPQAIVSEAVCDFKTPDWRCTATLAPCVPGAYSLQLLHYTQQPKWVFTEGAAGEDKWRKDALIATTLFSASLTVSPPPGAFPELARITSELAMFFGFTCFPGYVL
jgi:hypothetical protein